MLNILSFEHKLFVNKIKKLILFKNKNEGHLNHEILRSYMLSTFFLNAQMFISGY